MPEGAFADDGLQLRIEADQLDWRPEDAPLRASNLQTPTSSGPAGSSRGTHRHRPGGLTVRTPSLTWTSYAPRSDRVDVTVTASTDLGCMLAGWLVGTEQESDRDCGEVCVFEIDGDAVGPDSSRARGGVKAHSDPRRCPDMRDVEVPVRRGQRHTWSVRWDGEGVLIACEERLVYASDQRPGYPLQLLVDLFEIGPPAPGRVLVAEDGARPPGAGDLSQARLAAGWPGLRR